MARKQTRREKSKQALASLRRAFMEDPSLGLEAWRPRTRVVPNKKRAASRKACRGKVDW